MMRTDVRSSRRAQRGQLSRRGIALLVAALGATLLSAAQRIEFEDLFGPCGDFDLVAGPGAVVIEEVRFDTADVFSYNIGREASFPAGLGNPFVSDAYLFFAYGTGARITFPRPIYTLSFRTGQRTNMQTWPTFDLIAGDRVLTTFQAQLFAPGFVHVEPPPGSTEIRIVWTGVGSSSQLAIDELEYDFFPERLLGDLNCDGAVTFDDIEPLVLALVSRAVYESAYPACDWLNGDVNQDGHVDFDDLDGFIAALLMRGPG
jgi:hypothetical protein